jgi:hypothetical protein
VVPAKREGGSNRAGKQAEHSEEFKVWVKRQPGIESFSYELLVNGQVRVHEAINRDRSILVKI